MFYFSKVEKKNEVVVINSSQADDDLDASHVSVITVGEELPVKELDSWKSKEDTELSKPIRVPVNTASESNKVKMNGHPAVVKSNDPTEVFIVVNNSTNVHKLVIKFALLSIILLRTVLISVYFVLVFSPKIMMEL